jgi:acid phosphatase type 7
MKARDRTSPFTMPTLNRRRPNVLRVMPHLLHGQVSRRWLGPTIVLLMLFSLIAPLGIRPGGLVAAEEHSRLEIDPDHALPGETVEASGSHFPSDAEGTLVWDTDEIKLATFETDDDGEFSVEFTVPLVPKRGEYLISAIITDDENDSEVTASASIDVEASPTEVDTPAPPTEASTTTAPARNTNNDPATSTPEPVPPTPRATEKPIRTARAATATPTRTSDAQEPTPFGAEESLTLPLRAAFYYPWFPNAWTQHGIYPYTNYTPSAGYYDGGDPSIISQQIAAMQYGGIQVGISSWWEQGHHTDQRLPSLLAGTVGTGFKWTVYYEAESLGDPKVSRITNDLAYLRDHYASDPSYLKVDGKFVVFVYADGDDGCGMADRWTRANTVGAYLVLKVFSGYRTCANQPESWHQYAPSSAADSQRGYSYAISPGFWKVGESPRLERDLDRWAQNVRDMIASGAPWQLVVSFNEWGEGTSIESANEWQTSSGYGAYLDILNSNGQVAPVTNAPSATPNSTPTPKATRTATPVPTSSASPVVADPRPSLPAGAAVVVPAADARVVEASPRENFGSASTLQVDAGDGERQVSYLKFTINSLTGNITSAKLQLFVRSGTKDGPTVQLAANDWSEDRVTWANRPPLEGRGIDDKDALPAGSWIEYDVAPLMSGKGTYTFALVATSRDGVTFASSDVAVRRPLLILMVDGPGEIDPSPTTGEEGAVLLAAGDIADCGSSGDEATANLLDGLDGTVATLGDNAYNAGTRSEFANCYDPSWGRHKNRTRPAAGNHEYGTPGAAGYFNYFGTAAGDPSEGYYSYDLGTWHIVVLNSNCSKIGGCDADSPQYSWLKADLEAHPTDCTLAYWHHPLFSSADHGNNSVTKPLWQLLEGIGAELVLTGHDHDYERFAPQTADGVADPENGIREFVVGTGGKSHYAFESVQPNSEVRYNDGYGVLRLVLSDGSYSWEFISEAGKSFTDTGTGTCHEAPVASSGGQSGVTASSSGLSDVADIRRYRRDVIGRTAA